MKSRIITGAKGSGKTTTLLSLSANEGHASGFATLHQGSEYYLHDLSTGKTELLMTEAPVFEERFRKWYYSGKLFDECNEKLMLLTEGTVFLDEIGRLELEGKGFMPSLWHLLRNERIALTITVRDDFLHDVINAFAIKDYTLIKI